MRRLWWEDGSVIFSAITYWLESHKTHNNVLLSHLRHPQPVGPGLPYLYPQRNRVLQSEVKVKSESHATSDGRSVSQHVFVSSPRGFRGGYIRTNFNPTLGGEH
jgi:hypothetical protein